MSRPADVSGLYQRIGAVVDDEGEQFHWLICRVDDGRLVDEPGEVPVCGTSLAMLLDAALDSGGDIAHLETGRLDQLDRARHDE